MRYLIDLIYTWTDAAAGTFIVAFEAILAALSIGVLIVAHRRIGSGSRLPKSDAPRHVRRPFGGDGGGGSA